jgi:hypothetical protein
VVSGGDERSQRGRPAGRMGDDSKSEIRGGGIERRMTQIERQTPLKNKNKRKGKLKKTTTPKKKKEKK